MLVVQPGPMRLNQHMGFVYCDDGGFVRANCMASSYAATPQHAPPEVLRGWRCEVLADEKVATYLAGRTLLEMLDPGEVMPGRYTADTLRRAQQSGMALDWHEIADRLGAQIVADFATQLARCTPDMRLFLECAREDRLDDLAYYLAVIAVCMQLTPGGRPTLHQVLSYIEHPPSARTPSRFCRGTAGPAR